MSKLQSQVSRGELKLHVLSDLHLDIGGEWKWDDSKWSVPSKEEADVLVVAGDMANRRDRAVAWLSEYHKRSEGRPIVLVLGNHDFYHSSFKETLEFWQTCKLVQAGHVHLLENDSILIGGVQFVGCTYWTDMKEMSYTAIEAALSGLTDYRLIQNHKGIPIHPRDTAACHYHSRKYFDSVRRWREITQMIALDPALSEKKEAKDETCSPPLVVITHHLPTYKSVAPEYIDSPLNPCYASNTTYLIEELSPLVWIHGHTHSSLQYQISNTTIICNPRGYGNENPLFDPKFVIRIPLHQSAVKGTTQNL